MMNSLLCIRTHIHIDMMLYMTLYRKKPKVNVRISVVQIAVQIRYNLCCAFSYRLFEFCFCGYFAY